jgi:Bifunctional DNA primase/polymerase, N-terminal
MTPPEPPKRNESDVSNVSTGYVLRTALRMAQRGHRVIPIRPGEKRPTLDDWPNEASVDQITLHRWFRNTTNGLGWRMGEQADGTYLIAIDPDGSEGLGRLDALLDEHGARDVFDSTVMAVTGGGGMHYVFSVTEPIGGRRLAPKVDTRGEGGQIVVAPTIHPSGEPYRWVTGHEPWTIRPQPAPGWVIELLRGGEKEPAGATPRPAGVAVSRTGEDTPADWVRANVDIAQLLIEGGWTKMRGRRWCRPGKDPRDGHSAELHDDGRFSIWTTELPPGYRGHENADGSISMSPMEVYAAVHFGGDISAASAFIRRNKMPRQAPGLSIESLVPRGTPAAEPGRTAAGDSSEPPIGSALNLPDEFWSAREVLEHVRTAAWSMAASPDAVLGALLARYSAQVHPSIQLPNLGTLDIFSVIAGESGRGKSKAGKCARRAYHGADDRVLMDYNVGSGQGLAEQFFRWVDEEGNPCSHSKKGARKVLHFTGMHFATDEGNALDASAKMQGSIIIETLCAAWMGEPIGQALADPSKSRMIPELSVRVSAEIRIQTGNGWKLFADQYATTGLAQRMLCFHSMDPSIWQRHQAGTARPDWPGELRLPRPFLGGSARVLTYPTEVAAHLHEVEAQSHNAAWSRDPLDTHEDLSRAKVAGILALWRDSMDISIEDWELAGAILLSSKAVRSMLRSTHSQHQSDERHMQVQLAAEREVAVHDARHDATVRRAVDVIRGRVEAGKPLGKKYLSKPQREVYEEAMALCEQLGLVTFDSENARGGGWVARGGS